ncbi:hypothetical protein OYA92_24725, partial [Escherichia coli]|nr:hypothetical protein [Escherichia coli]
DVYKRQGQTPLTIAFTVTPFVTSICRGVTFRTFPPATVPTCGFPAPSPRIDVKQVFHARAILGGCHAQQKG